MNFDLATKTNFDFGITEYIELENIIFEIKTNQSFIKSLKRKINNSFYLEANKRYSIMNTDATNVPVTRIENPGKERHVAQLIDDIKSTTEANQAIDLRAITGPDAFRRMREINTPDGRKTAIFLTDTMEEPIYPDISHLPSFDLPQTGECFGPLQTTSSGAGIFAPQFNYRTELLMNLTEHFSSAVIVKLYSMAPLPMSATFWVYRTMTGTNVQANSNIGFMWKPSFQNCVYVVMPWADITLVRPTDYSLENIFGYLGIKPLSSFIHEEGTQTTLDVQVYFAPFNMKLCTPIAVTAPTSFMHTTAVTSYGKTTINLKVPGVLKIQGFYFEGTEIEEFGTRDFKLGDDKIPLTLNPGTYVLSCPRTGPMHLAITVLSRESGETFHLGNLSDAQDLPGLEPYKDTGIRLNPKIHHLNLKMNSEIEEPIQRLIDAVTRQGKKLSFVTKVLRQNPDEILVSLLIDGDVFANIISSSAKKGRKKLALTLASIAEEKGSVEIGEYQYNPNNNLAEQYHGQQGDRAAREVGHWQFYSNTTITEADASTVKNISIDFNTFALTSPFPSATREYLRHLLKHKYPLVKFQAIKTPYSNAILRVVQGTVGGIEELNQLPFREWNLAEDQEIEFYWDRVNPAIDDLVLNISFVAMGHNIAPSSVELCIYVNFAPVEFYHYRDYDSVVLPVEVGRLEVGETDLPTDNFAKTVMESTLEMTSGPSKSPVVQPDTESHIRIGTVPLEATATTAQPIKQEAIGAVVSERKYQYSGVITINPAETKFVILPLSHTNFPKYEVTTAKRYYRWRGRPYVRVTMDANFTMAGIVYIAQVDPRADYATLKAEDLINMYPHSKQVIKDGMAEMPLNWRSVDVRNLVSYATTAVSQIGDLAIVIATPSLTLSGLDPTIKFTLEFDMSEVTYEIPSLEYSDYSKPPLSFTAYPITPVSSF